MGVHIASPNPVRCAACYAQQPDTPHVDFEAATDGPVFVNPETGGVQTWEGGSVTIEDIVLCESCVRAGYRMLGLTDATPLEEAHAEAREARDEAAHWRARAEALQTAAAQWGVEQPDRRERASNARVPDALREMAVLAVRNDMPATEVADALGVTPQAVRGWVRKAEEKVVV